MRKFRTYALLLALLLSCCFGFSACTRRQERELAKIPTAGNYIIRQGTTYNQGNELVNIKDAIRKKIKQEQGLLFMDGESYRDMCYLEKDGVLYFMYRYEYGWDKDKMNSQLNDFFTVSKYAFGKTSVLHPDVAIAEYFTMEAWFSGEAIFPVGIFGDYAVFKHRYDPDFHIYDMRTMERVAFDVDGYDFLEYNRSAFALQKTVENDVSFRIYIEDMQQVTHTVEDGAQYRSAELYGEYLLLYSKEYSQSGHTVTEAYAFQYTTGEVLSNEQAFAMVEQRYTQAEYPDFTYQGAQFLYLVEEIDERMETGETDENGCPMYEYNRYIQLTVVNMDTQETYCYTNEQLFAVAPAMKQVMEIYGEEFYCCQIFTQGDDLFVVFVSDNSFFGMSTPGTSPRIVFKYNPATTKLDYIGYGLRTYYAVSHIYEA